MSSIDDTALTRRIRVLIAMMIIIAMGTNNANLRREAAAPDSLAPGHYIANTKEWEH